MEVADYRRMNTFELIDRINNTVTWDDEENEPCMRELCDRYCINFDAYDNYEDIWDQIIKEIYADVFEIGTMQECKKYVKERIDID